MSTENKIEFDTEKNDELNRRKILYSRLEPSNVEPRIIRFLISRHIVKDEHQADVLLVVLFFACIALSIFIFWHEHNASSIHVTTDAVLKVISRR